MDEHGQVRCDELAETDSSTETDSGNDASPKGGERKGEVAAWWKMPFEIMTLCLSRVKPVCSSPVAAAILGFVVLGRRLYPMRAKGLRAPLRIAVHDKRASNVVAHAERLNKAFFAVKHVPIIRTSPAAGSVITLANSLLDTMICHLQL